MTMRTSYDFSRGVRGKYLKRYRAGTNLARLDPDVRRAFADDQAINDALRGLIKVARRTARTAG